MKSRLVGNTHLVAGSGEMVQPVLEFLRSEGVHTQKNPDVYVREYSRFGVDDARALVGRAVLRPLGDRRVFVIVAADINREAQNALLKTLEDPSGNALFILIVPSPETLLPTLRSRMQTLKLNAKERGSEKVDVQAFLSAPLKKRLDLLKPLLEKGEDDPSTGLGAGRRDLSSIIGFLSALERELAKNPAGLQAVYRARRYAADKGALVKPLLEQVALLTPKV